MIAPDRKARELDVIVLRTAGLSQEQTAETLRISKLKVAEIERWFRSLSNEIAQMSCQAEFVKRTLDRLIQENPDQHRNDRHWQRLQGINAEHVLRHYGKIAAEVHNTSGAMRPETYGLARRYESQLRFVPPVDLVLPPLGAGAHRLTLVGQTNWYVVRYEDEAIRTVSIAESDLEGNDAAFYVHVSHDGTPRLVCPAEWGPGFDELLHELGAGAQEHVSERGRIGAEFLQQSRDALRAMEEDSFSRTGAGVREIMLQAARDVPALPFLSKPALPEKVLEDAFWRTAFQLAVSGQIPGDSKYRIPPARGEILFSRLFLGDTLIASGVSEDVAVWVGSHRQLITDRVGSPMIINLRQTHDELVEVHRWLLDALDQLQE